MANKKNLAAGVIAIAPSPALSGTTIVLEAGYGATMPSVPFYATVTPPGQLSTMGNSEIVLVTARSAETLTVTRAQKGTSAQPIAAGWPIANGVYVEDFDAPSAVYLNNGSQIVPGKTVMLYGWGFGTSSGGTIQASVPFGMTFKSPPIVVVSTRGYKNSSNPTNADDVLGIAGEIARGGQEVTTTGCKVFIQNASGGSITSGVRILFNIMVVGEPA